MSFLICLKSGGRSTKKQTILRCPQRRHGRSCQNQRQGCKFRGLANVKMLIATAALFKNLGCRKFEFQTFGPLKFLNWNQPAFYAYDCIYNSDGRRRFVRNYRKFGRRISSWRPYIVDNPDRQKSYKVFREMIDILESMAADGARFKKKGLPTLVDGANISPKNTFVVKQLGSSQFSTHFS